MNLEQRVETLEQELHVLKTQVQATLLDLQEFMLTNSFPTLRADDQAASEPPAPAASSQTAPAPRPPEAGDARPEPAPQGPRHDAPLHDYPMAQPVRVLNPDEDTQQVRINKIASVDQIVRQQPEAYDTYEAYDEPYGSEIDEPVSRRRANDYDEPAAHRGRFRRNGHSRRQPARHEPDWFDLERDDLDDDYPAELSGWVPPFLTNAPTEPNSIPNADWANLYMLEEWVQKRVDMVGAARTRQLIEQYNDERRIDPLLRVMMLQLVSIITEQQAAPSTSDPKNDEPRDVTHDMVLKMIARLQNTGRKGRKNHG